jgi:PTH1 family peptidyl-tRNA hydrolase
MKLIVGLGNPGRIYARNRHNVGFMCLNYFAKTQGIRLDKKQGQARIGTGVVASQDIIVARPQTFMNQSGESVRRLVKKFNINLDDLLVIHDDLDLLLGKIRIRRGGSSGGHKGIESIIADIDSKNFTRIRVGTGRPNKVEDNNWAKEAEIIEYVLSDFTSEEKQIIEAVIPRVGDAIYCLLTEGLMVAMNRYN